MEKLNIRVCDLEPEKVEVIKQDNYRQYCHDVSHELYLPREMWELEYEMARKRLTQKKEDVQE